MNNRIKTTGAFIIASAIIWGAVIVGSSYALRDTGCYAKIQNILAGGVLSHIILIWAPMIVTFRKVREGKEKDNT